MAKPRFFGVSQSELVSEAIIYLITQDETAWFMLQRIRNCFGLNNDDQMDGEIEADETYVGGKNKNRHAGKKVKETTDDKAPVLEWYKETVNLKP